MFFIFLLLKKKIDNNKKNINILKNLILMNKLVKIKIEIFWIKFKKKKINQFK